MIIKSKDNELIKHLKKLKEKKYRDKYEEFIVEGYKIVEEAISENVKIVKIVVSESFEKSSLYEKFVDYSDIICTIADNLFESISNVVNNQGVLAIIKKEKLEEKNIDYNSNFHLILNGIQDPGNIGTIIRTADSLNIKQIIVSRGTVEVYNPKIVRSTMGAIFRVKIIESANILDTIERLKEHGIKVYATDLYTNESIYSVDFDNSAVVIGNEARGVEEAVKNVCDKKIKIPMLGKTESLNASVATGVILYEVFRKKLQ